jgi:hypothetical protein
VSVPLSIADTGVTSVEFDRKDIEMNKMVVTTLESKFRLFDMRTQHPTGGFTCLTEKAHKATVWCVRHLPQNRDIFMTGELPGAAMSVAVAVDDAHSLTD